MSIVRSPRPGQAFTIIGNAVLRDERLSMRGLGLLVRLLSRPDNWETNSEVLAREFNCGREQTRGVLKELCQAGYMRLVKEQDAKGHWSSKWFVFDAPEEPKTEQPKSEQPEPGKPYVGDLGAIKKTDLLSTDKKNTPLTPQGGKPDKPARFDPLAMTLPESVSKEAWTDWIAYRRERKLSTTEKTASAQLKKLTKLAAKGHAPAQIIEDSIANGWQGLFEPKGAATAPAGKPRVYHDIRNMNYTEGVNDDLSF